MEYKKDYEKLIHFTESKKRLKIVLIYEKLLNMNVDFIYITSDKVFIIMNLIDIKMMIGNFIELVLK